MTTRASETPRVALRSAHQVRLVESKEEGAAAADLPPGVYGFTGSPGLAAPLFAERRYRNFEVHHLRDGSVAIVGFVTPALAAILAVSDQLLAITIYPDAEGDSTEIVSIPYSRIVHHRQYSVRNAAGLELQVGPIGHAGLVGLVGRVGDSADSV